MPMSKVNQPTHSIPAHKFVQKLAVPMGANIIDHNSNRSDSPLMKISSRSRSASPLSRIPSPIVFPLVNSFYIKLLFSASGQLQISCEY